MDPASNVETPEGEAKRRRQRVLFDAIADRYQSTRRGYPADIVDRMVDIAGLAPGDPVLEVGCGTGQLTEDLVRRGLHVTAIDIGPAMVELTARRLAALDRVDVPAAEHATVHATAFEDVDLADVGGSFRLVASATAFHWIDPSVAWTKTARLLRPGGWVAIVSTGEGYHDPFGAELRQQWIRYSDDGGAWATTRPPTVAEIIDAAGLFEPAITAAHDEHRTLPVDVVVELEQTRATFLAYDADTRQRWVADLRALLASTDDVELTQHCELTMARLAGS